MCIEAHHADLRQEGDVLQREVLGAALGPLGDLVEGLEQAPLAPRQDDLRVGLVVDLVRLQQPLVGAYELTGVLREEMSRRKVRARGLVAQRRRTLM